MFELQSEPQHVGCSLSRLADGSQTHHLSLTGTIWCLNQDGTCPDTPSNNAQEHYKFNVKVF